MSAMSRWRELPWSRWRRQAAAVARLELRKCFLGRRLVAVYFLTLGPLLLMALAAVIRILHGRPANPVHMARGIAVFMDVFMLRVCVFFGCAAIFTNIFRGEVLEKTLHYYFLAPVRREVLVAGKFLAGLTAAVLFFTLSVGGCYVLHHLPLGAAGLARHFGSGPGLGHLAGYLAVTVLACLGYGAVFTLFGLLFRNPMVPALGLLGWESINFLLPPLLKKISVVHYLQSLLPVAVDKGPLAVLVEPTPPVLAVAGLVVLAVVVLAVAAWRIRRMEVAYAAD